MDITKIDKEFFWELSALLESRGIGLIGVDGNNSDFNYEVIDENNAEITREIKIELEQIVLR